MTQETELQRQLMHKYSSNSPQKTGQPKPNISGIPRRGKCTDEQKLKRSWGGGEWVFECDLASRKGKSADNGLVIIIK